MLFFTHQVLGVILVLSLYIHIYTLYFVDDFFLYVLLLPDKKIDLTILLLFGGTVNPVVLICCPNHFELMEHDFEVPHIWNK